MEFSRLEYWSGQPFLSPGDLPNPGIEPRSPTLQADSLPAEPQGQPKNTRVGSLSLLQQIFPTQESNQGLLHCGQILYQLSYEGSPILPQFNLILTLSEIASAYRLGVQSSMAAPHPQHFRCQSKSSLPSVLLTKHL